MATQPTPLYPLPLPPRLHTSSHPPPTTSTITSTISGFFHTHPIFKKIAISIILILLLGGAIAAIVMVFKGKDHKTSHQQDNHPFIMPSLELQILTPINLFLRQQKLLYSIAYTMTTHSMENVYFHGMYTMTSFHSIPQYIISESLPLPSTTLDKDASFTWAANTIDAVLLNSDQTHIIESQINRGNVVFDLRFGGNITSLATKNEVNFEYTCPITILLSTMVASPSPCTLGWAV